jgi:hypothetical protein
MEGKKTRNLCTAVEIDTATSTTKFSIGSSSIHGFTFIHAFHIFSVGSKSGARKLSVRCITRSEKNWRQRPEKQG